VLRRLARMFRVLYNLEMLSDNFSLGYYFLHLMLYFLAHQLLRSVKSSWMNRVHWHLLFTSSFGISSLDRFSWSLIFLCWLILPPFRLDPLDGEDDILLLLPPGQPDLGNQRIRREYFGDLPPSFHKCKFMMNIELIGGLKVFRFENGHQDVFTSCLTADAGDPLLV